MGGNVDWIIVRDLDNRDCDGWALRAGRDAVAEISPRVPRDKQQDAARLLLRVVHSCATLYATALLRAGEAMHAPAVVPEWSPTCDDPAVVPAQRSPHGHQPRRIRS